MIKLIFRYFSILLLIVAILYLGFKLFSKNHEHKLQKMQFTKHQHVIKGYIKDTLYHFDAIIENKSNQEQRYSVVSTCGCTVVSKSNGIIQSKAKDTLGIVVNTYGKKNPFFTQLLLLNEEKATIDDVIIRVK